MDFYLVQWKTKFLFLLSGIVFSWSLCPDPGTPDNGYVCDSTADNGSYQEGDVIWFCCHNISNLQGNNSITCIAPGNWDSDIPKCVDNGNEDGAYIIIILLSVAGALLLTCNICLIVLFVCLYAKRRQKNKKIDQYLNMFRDRELSIDSDASCEYVEPNHIGILTSPSRSHPSVVANPAFNTTMSHSYLQIIPDVGKRPLIFNEKIERTSE